MIHVNVNDSVRVKLTNDGVRVANEFWAKFGPGPHREVLVRLVDMTTEFQLHELMEIFGSHMQAGFHTQVFENNTIMFHPKGMKIELQF